MPGLQIIRVPSDGIASAPHVPRLRGHTRHTMAHGVLPLEGCEATSPLPRPVASGPCGRPRECASLSCGALGRDRSTAGPVSDDPRGCHDDGSTHYGGRTHLSSWVPEPHL